MSTLPEAELLDLIDWEDRAAFIPRNLTDALSKLSSSSVEPLRLSELMRTVVAGCCSRWRDETTPDGALELLSASHLFEPIIVIGGSHAQIYSWGTALREEFLVLRLATWGGAAKSLGNPKSRTQYGELIRNFLFEVQARINTQPPPVLFQMGQVDVEFVYNFRRLDKEQRMFEDNDLLEFITDSADAYTSYIETLTQFWPADRIYVASIFPPALNDETVRRGYTNALIASAHTDHDPLLLEQGLASLEFPDWSARTLHNRWFNEAVARGCAARGIQFLDFFDRLCGPDGLVDLAFLGDPPGEDHHLDGGKPATQALSLDVLRAIHLLNAAKAGRATL
jgi:hypothetical protein